MPLMPCTLDNAVPVGSVTKSFTGYVCKSMFMFMFIFMNMNVHEVVIQNR